MKRTIGKLSTIEFFFGENWKVQYWPIGAVDRKRQYNVKIFYDGRHVATYPNVNTVNQTNARRLIQKI
jgi:hypothetical protein